MVPAILAALFLGLTLGFLPKTGAAEEKSEQERIVQKIQHLTEKARLARTKERLDDYREFMEQIAELQKELMRLQGRQRQNKEALGRRLKMAYALLNRARRQNNQDEVKRLQEEIRELTAAYKGGRESHEKGRGMHADGEVMELKRQFDEVCRHIEETMKQREKALEDFELDRMDTLSRKLKDLENLKTRLARALEGKKVREGPDTNELFKKLNEARERGDTEEAERIRREIQRLRRGDRSTHGKPIFPDVLTRLKKIVDKLRKMAERAEMAGDRERTEGIAHLHHAFQELLNRTANCRTPEEAQEIAGFIQGILKKGRTEMAQARRAGDDEKVKILDWVLGELSIVHKGLKKAKELKLKWKAGSTDVQEGSEDRRRTGNRRREDWREVAEGVARLMREAAEADREGNREQAEELRRKAREMREKAFHRKERPEPRTDRDRGRSEARFERELDKMQAQLEKAERKGDWDEAEELRRNIRRLRRKMEEPRRDYGSEEEPRRNDRDKVEGRSREAQELKKDIDRLRRELKELKKLLMELLKERKRDR
jgi:hypothetical protein